MTLRPNDVTMGPVRTDPVANYLQRLDAALVGPRHVRRDLLAEARDHLEDATAAYVTAGKAPYEAASLAVRDFGTVEQIAPAYQATLAVAASRRTALLMLVVLGVQPFLWDEGLSLASSAHVSDPDLWILGALDWTIELSGLFALVGTVLALLATGVGSRWLRSGRQTARITGIFGLICTVTVPVLGVSMLGLTGGLANPVLCMQALLFLLLPLAAVAYSARRTLATA
jgi:hypothetical protein